MQTFLSFCALLVSFVALNDVYFFWFYLKLYRRRKVWIQLQRFDPSFPMQNFTHYLLHRSAGEVWSCEDWLLCKE